MVVAGSELLPVIYQMRGGVDEVRLAATSGVRLAAGERIALVRGRARTLLECERVALNFLQRLSGIATAARRYADAVDGTKCQVLDTRKTTPGLRRLEKMAAAAGGITNHRMGLYDAVLIKNNHVAAAGGVRAALERAFKTGLPVEIEVHSHAELEEALECGAKSILLDNFSPGGGRRAHSLHRQARQGRVVRRHQPREHPGLRGTGADYRLLRRDHAFGQPPWTSTSGCT